MKTISLLCFLFLMVFILSCKKEKTITQTPSLKKLDYDYNSNLNSNDINNELAQFGRLLFYDKDLSINANVSCASCHKQAHSFADNVALSEGFLTGLTIRNTPPLNNAGFNDFFLWDNSSEGLINTCINPIFNPIEMGMTSEILSNRIRKKSLYVDLFLKNINFQTSTEQKIGIALSEFILAMVDGNSKFDKHLKNEKIFSLEENMGKEVFLTHCNNCHLIFNRFNTSFDSIPYSNNSSGFGNIGLSFNNEGNGNNGKGFRIPNLRNIEFTAPYMHDGRFNSLREVIEHYNSGVILNPNLSSFLIGADGNPKQMNLSELEKEALEKFLLTLSDDSIILDEKFSNPYIE